MGPPVSLYKTFNAIEKVLDLIPPLRINQMTSQLILGEMDRAVSLHAQIVPGQKSQVLSIEETWIGYLSTLIKRFPEGYDIIISSIPSQFDR
ncbi:hypothetical protein N7491_008415 [Penicillium cf. griseofulvum]|uniref:Uncharacterized protein n=1 Tax=Penicillium cf. griseofulvum TaxID=2972120 RepID=A0A9W9SW64_9EURO|nr:hypothetical protein N7472_005984 [Penicillium cf. griseofulvum]KAJ5423199.1 hypothetical protein N7491_008415 [Penicillium cf. griseofulvum]KAJ5431536.1 hypothetical protein N7445_009268 [Penicillium cf. griseofulvum]